MSQQINLFSPVFLQKQKYFSSIAIAQASAVLFVAAAGMSFYTEYKMESLVRQAKVSESQLARMQTQLKEVASRATPKEKSKALEEQIKRAELELRAEERVRDFLKTGELGNTRGYSEFFRAFARQIGDGIWLTGFTIIGPGAEMSVDGKALHADLIPAYIGRLRREPVMQGKTFAAIEMKSVQPEPKHPEPKAAPVVARRVGSAQPAQVTASAGPDSSTKLPAYVEFSLVSSGLKQRVADAQGGAPTPSQGMSFAVGGAQ